VNAKHPSEHRQYIRLKSTFSVKFTIAHLQESIPGIGWRHGYTSNISQGGIGLESSQLNEAVIKYLDRQDIYLETYILAPFASMPIKAICEVAWFKKQQENTYFIGLKFRSITKEDLNRILGYAGWMRFIPNFLRKKIYEKSSQRTVVSNSRSSKLY